MGWWQRLLSVEAPPDASLAGVEPTLRGLWPLLLTVILGILFLAAAVVVYCLESRRLGILPRLALMAVRTCVLGLVCFLIFWPVQCTAVFEGQRPRGVVLLVDNTQSMAQADK